MNLSSRSELLKASEIELQKIRKSLSESDKMRKGIDYEKYGGYIYDPDISNFDWEELRKKDPTLPKKDPRKSYEHEWTIEPYIKWLYFSNELGSYVNRRNLYYGADNPKDREKLMKRLDPLLLTKKQRIETDPVFNITQLKNELPKTFVELMSDKKKWGVSVRYLLGKLLYAMQED
jgi:hypothetical protein